MKKFKRYDSGDATAVAAPVAATPNEGLFMHSRALPSPPLTDAVLAEAQAELGMALPHDFVEVCWSSLRLGSFF
jgi:hypothetical protein